MTRSVSASPIRVLLPDGESRHALKVVRCLAQGASSPAPVSVHLCTGPDVPKTLRRSRHVAGIHPIAKTLSEETRMQAIADVARRIEADVVLPLSVDGGRLLARHAGLFGGIALAPLSSEDTQRIAGDKGLLVQFMDAHGIPHPPATGLRPIRTLPRRLERLAFPVLVKATVGAGGHHIHRFECPEAVVGFARQQAEDGREYIVQSYVEGWDVDYSVLAVNGTVIAYTIQQALTADRQEQTFGPPSFIEFVADPKVEAVGRTLVEGLGFSGIAHVDLRYDLERQAVYVLEINTRVWGSILGSLRAGVNFPLLACQAALGHPLPAVDYRHIEYATGELALKRVWDTLRLGIPLRHSCMAFALDDPVPDIATFLRLKWEKGKRILGWGTDGDREASTVPRAVVPEETPESRSAVPLHATPLSVEEVGGGPVRPLK